MSSRLHGFTGVTAVVDASLIYGADREDHDKNLETLLERAKTIGLHLNTQKCKFLQDKLKYIGCVLTSEGVRLDPAKV